MKEVRRDVGFWPQPQRFRDMWWGVGYGLLLLLWWIAWLTTIDSIWWLALINRIIIWLFVPIPIFLVWACFQRHWFNLVGLLLAGVIALNVVGEALLPHQPATAAAANLRMMSFNILFSNTNLAGLARAIRAADADVIALQEVQPAQITHLSQELQADYPYLHIAPEHPYGTPAILSRLPFQSTEILNLEADRQAVLVRIAYADRMITIVSAHLLAYGLEWVAWQDLPQVVQQRVREQERQAMRILEATAHDVNVLIACDCNSPETSGTARILHRSLQSSAHVAGWARPADLATQPDRMPTHIDYILYRGALQAVAYYRRTDTGGSDHQPIVAELVVLPSTTTG